MKGQYMARYSKGTQKTVKKARYKPRRVRSKAAAAKESKKSEASDCHWPFGSTEKGKESSTKKIILTSKTSDRECMPESEIADILTSSRIPYGWRLVRRSGCHTCSTFLVTLSTVERPL